jgi:hypothetical protein
MSYWRQATNAFLAWTEARSGLRVSMLRGGRLAVWMKTALVLVMKGAIGNSQAGLLCPRGRYPRLHWTLESVDLCVMSHTCCPSGCGNGTLCISWIPLLHESTQVSGRAQH